MLKKIFLVYNTDVAFHRILNLQEQIKNKSTFLLGPRQTGKSTLLAATMPKDSTLIVDLLDSRTFSEFVNNPALLGDRIAARAQLRYVVIDEIQKLPELLDEVHRQIEKRKDLRFVLTGSSARRLRRSGTNLLGGRARLVSLFPLVSKEVLAARPGDTLERLMLFGGLPSIYLSEEPAEDLSAYVGLYLKEEIQAEGLVRSLPAFSRFLHAAALSNAEQVVFSNIASDAQLPARTVQEYFQILDDTLVGKMLPSFTKTPTRKAMTVPKFYYFDPGVANALLGRKEISVGSPEYGKVLEHFIFCEITAALSYLKSGLLLSYWRSTSKMEVDFVFGKVAVEVKGSGAVSKKETKPLLALAEDIKGLRKIVVCHESQPRKTEEGIEILPLKRFLEMLWDGEFF